MKPAPATYYSNGKLLLTGEYFVLDGATVLAVPTRFGQSLAVEGTTGNKTIWKSLDVNGKIWFAGQISKEGGNFN
ncbi:MAG: GHMP kinase, partial [Marinirhabdus sp.]